MPSRHAALAALIAVLLALALAACGDDDDSEPAGTSSSEPAQTEEAAAPEEKTAEISTNVEAKPEIGKPAGDPPTELIKEDIVKGKGPAVKEGDSITVHYVGVNFSTGDQFDASWDAGAPVTFPLAQGQLIDGWVQGIPGMKAGGRRKLTIPSDLAYGPEGRPPQIPPNEALVFVIDLKKIG